MKVVIFLKISNYSWVSAGIKGCHFGVKINLDLIHKAVLIGKVRDVD